MVSGSCPNWLCNDPARRIKRIRAIAYFSGELRTAIQRYKYDKKYGWSLIFGRLLAAWLDRNGRDCPPDLIIANPTYLGDDGASLDHTQRVIEADATEDVLGEWPFGVQATRALQKTRATRKSAGNSAAVKRAAAAELRAAPHIPDAARTQGRRILVYDDVCTTGSQLDTIAGYLIQKGGATEVEGVVLARAPWKLPSELAT
jgi:predicted amidophosphoribosyltransferase